MELRKRARRIFQHHKENVCGKSSLVHYAKDRENILRTEASKTGLGISLWQNQSDEETKPILERKRKELLDRGKKYWLSYGAYKRPNFIYRERKLFSIQTTKHLKGCLKETDATNKTP